jgi:hypothetical protein
MGGGKRNAYRVLVCKPERREATCKAQDNIKIDFKEIGFRINLGDDRNKWRAVLNVLFSS